MERVRHQLACANCMLANANHPVNKDYQFFCKKIPLLLGWENMYELHLSHSNALQKDNICYVTYCPISLSITHLLNEFKLITCHSKVCDSTVWNWMDS